MHIRFEQLFANNLKQSRPILHVLGNVMYVNDCVLGGWRSTVGQGLVLVEHLAKGRFPYRTEQLGQLNRL